MKHSEEQISPMQSKTYCEIYVIFCPYLNHYQNQFLFLW